MNDERKTTNDEPRAGGQIGFTLLELLVALSILALVTAAIAASFAAGVRVWSAAMEVSGAEEATRAELAVLRRDLMNARRFGPLTFEGGPRAMAFPIVQTFPDALVPGEQLGLARYWHDPREQALFRQTRPIRGGGDWSDVAAERWIAGVEHIAFEYLPFPDDGRAADGAAAWQDEWTQTTNRPLGVRIRLRLRTPPDERTETVILPDREWAPEKKIVIGNQ